ncbi:MAG: S41 family peptidase [Flavobacteriales bacterium]
MLTGGLRSTRRRVLLIGAIACLAHARANAQTSDPAPTFDTTALQADLSFLEQRLLSKHPDPFMYADRAQLVNRFDSLRSRIRTPMSGLHFLAHITSLYPLLGDGHTLFLPSDADGGSKRYLPLEPVWIPDHLYIRRNGSTDQRLAPGTEILAINGIVAAALMDTLLMRQIRDGYNSTYPQWILNRWFKEYYRFSFGEPEQFDLLLSTPQGNAHVIVDALPPDSIRANILGNTTQDPPTRPAFGLRYAQGDGIAILTIPSLEKGNVSNAMIDAAFSELQQRKADRLILDLRGDQGGEPKYAKRLLAHLLSVEFELVHEGPAAGRTKSRPDAFTGTLAVLMDGGSFSVTSMVLSCLERHQRATFIGEEAGGNRTLLSGSPTQVRLPNTRINCSISTRLWRLADRPNDGHGVMPTIAVSPTIEDIVNGRDPVMQAALVALHSK